MAWNRRIVMLVPVCILHTPLSRLKLQVIA